MLCVKNVLWGWLAKMGDIFCSCFKLPVADLALLIANEQDDGPLLNNYLKSMV